MWNAIDSQKKNISDISLSAGNTGALLVISRLLLDTLEKIERPALAGLWPNSNNMSVVLDLGANIECNTKNLIDFCSMGSALHKALFKSAKPKIALLNVYVSDELVKEVDIFADEDVKRSNIFSRIFKSINYLVWGDA